MTENYLNLALERLSGVCIALSLAVILSGCQEDSGQIKAASAGAAAASEERLDGAVSSIQKTLGQEPTGQNTAATTTDRPTLRWTQPSAREDGSRLLASNIQEYRIYYRLRHHSNFQVIEHPVENGTAFKLSQFEPGAYEFSITTVDTDGRESQRSEVVTANLI